MARVRDYLGDDSFCFTYGDGLADVQIDSLISHHQQMGKLATLTAVQPPGRYGALHLDAGSVRQFQEKPDGDNAWINGGFFVLQPAVLDLIDNDSTSWEADVLPRLAEAGELSAYRHKGFWQPMDTLRDKTRLEDLWNSGQAPWKRW